MNRIENKLRFNIVPDYSISIQDEFEQEDWEAVMEHGVYTVLLERLVPGCTHCGSADSWEHLDSLGCVPGNIIEEIKHQLVHDAELGLIVVSAIDTIISE